MSTSQVFKLEIACDNAAFEDNPYTEIARILRNAADKVESDPRATHWFQTIRDINGNDVGSFALKHADYFNKG